MENPYDSPKTYVKPIPKNHRVDPKIINQLILFKSQMRVISLLRQDGMEYEDAREIVEAHAGKAQAILDQKNLGWKIVAWLLLFTGTVLPVIVYLSGHLSIVSTAPLFGALYCFRRCEKIKF